MTKHYMCTDRAKKVYKKEKVKRITVFLVESEKNKGGKDK